MCSGISGETTSRWWTPDGQGPGFRYGITRGGELPGAGTSGILLRGDVSGKGSGRRGRGRIFVICLRIRVIYLVKGKGGKKI